MSKEKHQATRRLGASIRFAITAAAVCATVAPLSAHAEDKKFLIGIVELQLANPFFGKLEKAAVDTAKKHGLDVMTAEAKTAGDSATQIAAIENMINRGVRGITLDPANATALVPIVKKARDAGIVVVTTNTSLQPRDAAEAAYETDNFQARRADRPVGEGDDGIGSPPISRCSTTICRTRRQKPDTTASSRGSASTRAIRRSPASALNMGNAETGQTAMENLLSAHPDINVLYTINEPAAQGAHFRDQEGEARRARDLDRRQLLGRPQRRGRHDRRDGNAVPGSHGPDGGRSDHQGGQRRREAQRLPQYRHRPHHGSSRSRDRIRRISKWGLENCWGA